MSRVGIGQTATCESSSFGFPARSHRGLRLLDVGELRAPHAWLADGKSTLDLFGNGFVLMRVAGDRQSEMLIKAAAHRGVPLDTFDVTSPELARLYERAMTLVRPDGHVAWRGDVLPDDPLALIDTVRGTA